MRISADWVLPVDAMPIRDGAVRVHNGRIAEVGRPEQLRDTRPQLAFPGCAIIPGLVDAHTHLSHAALEALLPPASLPGYAERLHQLVRRMDADDFASSAAYGALRRLECGTTVVGDFVYGPEAPAAAADIGLGGMFYWQVDAAGGVELARMLEETEFPHMAGSATSRTRYGLAPEVRQGDGRPLLKAVLAQASAEHLPLAIQLTESAAETELFESPLAVHCLELAVGKAHVLAKHTRGVVLSPRSNDQANEVEPPVARLLRAKATLALGTDQAFGEDGCDLLAEARALRELEPSLTASRLLRMLTLDGAEALGVGSIFGSLTPGKQADLTVVRIPETDEPAEAVVRHGGAATVEAVMTAGIWRIRERRPTFPSAVLLRAAAAVAAKLAAPQ